MVPFALELVSIWEICVLVHSLKSRHRHSIEYYSSREWKKGYVHIVHISHSTPLPLFRFFTLTPWGFIRYNGFFWFFLLSSWTSYLGRCKIAKWLWRRRNYSRLFSVKFKQFLFMLCIMDSWFSLYDWEFGKGLCDEPGWCFKQMRFCL